MSVYTELNRDDVLEILQGYALGDLQSYEGIAAGIENSNFFVDTDLGRYVLTLFERMSEVELPYFMRLMHNLSEKGFPCPAVQVRHDGELLFSYKGKQGCIVSCLPGRTLDRLSEVQLTSAGEMMARLHEAGKGFPEHRDDPTPPAWMRETADMMRSDLSARYGDEVARLLEDELAWQSLQLQQHLPQGVIHADYFCDNILFSGDEVTGVIDFYYASDGPWAYDLAIAVNALACGPEEGDAARIEALVSGYERIRRLNDEERQAWPGLLRLAALRFWVSRLYDALYPREGAMTQIKDPEEYRLKLLHWRQAHA
ncbi:MAG TPA: homoserine kinase [Mariprofundaceae bacterium]|nr:homoserine kinase [Mariprofundaceae bacterium]